MQKKGQEEGVKSYNSTKNLSIYFLILLTLFFCETKTNAHPLASNTLATTIPTMPITVTDFEQAIEAAIAQKKYDDALSIAKKGLTIYPDNAKLLYKKAAIYADLEKFKLSLEALKEIQLLEPENIQANKLRKMMQEKKDALPLNELRYEQNEAYVSDLKDFWNFYNLYYYRLTDYGKFGARTTHAQRFGTSAQQYELQAYPIFFDGLFYADLSFAYAGKQILFPEYNYRTDLYLELPKGFELSGGHRYIKFQSVEIDAYTALAGKYLDNYYAWGRFYLFQPSSAKYYEAAIRRYFSDQYNFITLKIGAGRVPDIADISVVNQLIIFDQKAVILDGEVTLNKIFFMKWGLGYAHQVFDNGHIRNITDATLGIGARF